MSIVVVNLRACGKSDSPVLLLHRLLPPGETVPQHLKTILRVNYVFWGLKVGIPPSHVRKQFILFCHVLKSTPLHCYCVHLLFEGMGRTLVQGPLKIAALYFFMGNPADHPASLSHQFNRVQ